MMMEIASLTKIMTAYVSKELISKFKINMDETVIV
jgi:D-alanyl-D-alanine carboxypeptidase